MLVAAFESRMAAEMASLIRRHGGEPLVAPSMREVALDESPAVREFVERLAAGRINVVLLLTGVGTRALAAAAGRYVSRETLVAQLARTTVVARGPKPVAACKELGIRVDHRIPEPNTWREILEYVDLNLPVEGQTVAIQEYGEPNRHLVRGLEARGARVLAVPVYRWDLPEETGPLRAAVRAIAERRVDLALFTSQMQVVHAMRMAAEAGVEDDFRRALAEHTLVCSIGPTTAEALWNLGLTVDLEPEHPKMGQLAAAAFERGPELLAKKRRFAQRVGAMELPEAHGLQPVGVRERAREGVEDKLINSRFMRACRREPVDVTPIWLMRQAGRYMPEYRKVRDKVSFLELCKTPELAAEVTVRAVERLGVDAAIVFADLLPILEPMGAELEYAKGEGPVIHNPIREPGDVERMRELESVEALEFVFEAARLARAALPGDIPLLGFAGAPFTLASYAIEGGGSRNYLHTKVLMYRDPAAWDELMGRLVRSVARYLNGQIAAGVQAVQVFDSWVGCLSPDDYRRYVLPHSRALIEAIAGGVPVIHFTTGNPALLPLVREASVGPVVPAGGGLRPHVVGIDWRIELAVAWEQAGHDVAVQGNLDPLVLLADRREIRRRAKQLLDSVGGRPGHIFNLGHGILPQTPVENAVALIDAVHELSSRMVPGYAP